MTPHPHGRMLVAHGLGGGVRLLAVSLPGPAQVLAERHNLGKAATKRAAEGLIATALLSGHIKGDERLTVDFQITSPASAAVFEVHGDGTLRGRFRPEEIRDQPELFGFLSVAKSFGKRELYRGIAKVDGENVEAALQRYLTESQQVDARVRLVADLDEEGRVEYADGCLLERLPAMDRDRFLAHVEELRDHPKRVMDQLALGSFGGEPIELLGDIELRFACGCAREKVSGMIRALGAGEITSMINEQAGAEVVCHFCNEQYEFSVADLEALRDGVADTVGDA